LWQQYRLQIKVSFNMLGKVEWETKSIEWIGTINYWRKVGENGDIKMSKRNTKNKVVILADSYLETNRKRLMYLILLLNETFQKN